MKLHKAVTTCAVVLGLALGSICFARAVEVTFRVNMAVKIAAVEFYPGFDTVEVRGSFDGWGAGITLAADATEPHIYESTLDLGTSGTVVDYKFVIHQEDEVIVWEATGVGEGGAQNRQVTVPDTALILPAVYFNNETTAPGNVAVTFRVNLSIQEEIGNFDPASHTAEVRGSFDNWGSGLNLAVDPLDDNVYQGTVNIFGSAGAIIDYKFVINQAGTLVWEGDVGGGGAANRSLTLESGSQTVPVVYFDNLSTDPGAGIPVTFGVNLGVRAALGLFNPDLDAVVVSGQFNNWSVTDSPLTNTTEEPYVYRGTYPIKASPGSLVPHKFVASGVWEEGDNRTFVLADAEQTLPVVFFNRQDNLGAVTVNSLSDGQITLEWAAASGIRLETSSNVLSGWQDVPDTVGQGSATVPVGSGDAFFRLAGP